MMLKRHSGDGKVFAADLGPVRYLAALLGVSPDQVLRLFILAVPMLPDPAAALLLLAATEANKIKGLAFVIALETAGHPQYASKRGQLIAQC